MAVEPVRKEELTYPFRLTPYRHQLDYFTKHKHEQAFAIYAEMGLGKSFMLIANAAWLYDNGHIDGVLIVAPKGLYLNWVDKELPTHMPEHIQTIVAAWSASPRKEEREAMARLDASKADDGFRWLVMNVEAFSTPRGVEYAKQFLLRNRALIAVDESTTISNPTAKRTKALLGLARYCKYRRILSGEPAANSPLKLYSQFGFLSPSLLGYGSYFAFRNHFAQMGEIKVAGNRTVKVVQGYKNVEELQQKIKPHAFIVKKADCLDLPPKIYVTREVEMGAKQRKAYEMMRQQAVVFLSEIAERNPDRPLFTLDDEPDFSQITGASLDTPEVTFDESAKNVMTTNIVITQILRLHQIACGFMSMDDKKTIIDFDESNDRLNQTLEVLETCGTKAIIWATYRHNIEQITKAVAEAFGPASVLSYYGDTKMEDRRKAVLAIQDPSSKVRYLVGNQQTAGFGLTLTEATTQVYYANSYNAELRGQAEDRSHRIGTKMSVTYVDLVARETVDEVIIKALRQKKSLSQLVTPSNWRSFL